MCAGWYSAALDNCPFCTMSPDRVTLENQHALAFHDAYPIGRGHTLVIQRAHVESVFDLGPAEQAGVWDLVAQVRARLAQASSPDDFTIGVNDDVRTLPQAHTHVIPR